MDILRQFVRLLASTHLLALPESLVQQRIWDASLSPDKVDTSIQANGAPTCPAPGLSCPAASNSDPVDECCLETDLSGHFLATQFWDTNPALGSNTAWTLHGLWPDHCTGGFEQFCDGSRSKSPVEIEDILTAASKSTHPGLLDFMNRMWLSLDHRNSNLWSHEWNKHGTCISTLKPRCYGEPETGSGTLVHHHQDVLDYFTHATSLFAKLDTYAFLESHGIVPDSSKTYNLADIEAAIRSSSSGNDYKDSHTVTIRCNNRHELDEVWYHFLVRGPMRDANSSADPMEIFVPTKADGQISNCPARGIKYLPKSGYSHPPPPPPPHQPTHTTSHGGSYPTTTSTPFNGKGFLHVDIVSSSSLQSSNDDDQPPKPFSFSSAPSCLIRTGDWYASGTCATYTAKQEIVTHPDNHNNQQETQDGDKSPSSSLLFTLQSSNGPCAILPQDTPTLHAKKGQFVCSRHLRVQSIFTASPRPIPSTNVNENTNDATGTYYVLTYNNQTTFHADEKAHGFDKVPVFAFDHDDDDDDDKDDDEANVKIEIYWEAR